VGLPPVRAHRRARKAVQGRRSPRRHRAAQPLSARGLDFAPPHRVDEGMTKADLVAAMAKASGGSKVSSEKALETFVRGVFQSLRRGRRVTIGGFGTFMVSRRAERNGRNPRTGKAIRIPAKKAPRSQHSRSA